MPMHQSARSPAFHQISAQVTLRNVLSPSLPLPGPTRFSISLAFASGPSSAFSASGGAGPRACWPNGSNARPPPPAVPGLLCGTIPEEPLIRKTITHSRVRSRTDEPDIQQPSRWSWASQAHLRRPPPRFPVAQFAFVPSSSAPKTTAACESQKTPFPFGAWSSQTPRDPRDQRGNKFN